MMLLKIAFRNILRNLRRSLMTMGAIAIGAIATLTFAGFMSYIIVGFKTQTIDRTGHLTVYHAGYFDFGAGNPGAYGIRGYQQVMALIKADPVLAPRLAVVTPTVSLFGIAGNSAADTSKTFFGVGYVPSDRYQMVQWNEYHLDGPPIGKPALTDADEDKGVVGSGLARILGLCEALKMSKCPPPTEAVKPPTVEGVASQDFSALVSRDIDAQKQPADGLPRIDLLGATAGGAPNVMTLSVVRAQSQGAKEIDDAYVGMHIQLAQELLYGRGEHQATAIVIQLNHTADMGMARARLTELFKEHNLPLEVRDFIEITPFYTQVLGLFGSIFLFIAVIMVVIVLFTVANTMSMCVMERTNEIGTSRALGVRRAGIRRQFVVEGSMLGMIGATVGVILSFVVGMLVNLAGLTWVPPGQADPIPLRLLMNGVGGFQIATWVGLVLVAMIAGLLPANRAARMPVVDALRHV